MVAQRLFKAKVPGSLMLLGEYSVLHGKKALAVAINKYITVTLVPRHDNLINISSALGNFKSVLPTATIKFPKSLQFVLTTIHSKIKKIKSGFDLKITSDFPPKIGFGSSAAVTVATLSVLKKFLKEKNDRAQIFKEAKKIIRRIQKDASGTDLAASIWGGIVVNQTKKKPVKIKASFPLAAVYSGYKFPTAKAIVRFKKNYQKNSKTFTLFFELAELFSNEAIKTIKTGDWKRLGILINLHQGIQDAFLTNNSDLAKIILQLRKERNVWGAKISGSGLGDSIIALGKIANDKMPIKISTQGLSV
jgi:mevalonate kinase